MSVTVFYKLLAIIVIVALGWVVGKMKWLSHGSESADPVRTLSNAALYIFIPALLFRTTARIDFATLPWRTLSAFFIPALILLLAVYAWQRRWNRTGRLPIPAPSVRAVSASFGNTVQVGIPMAAALFGEAGLSIHIAIVSLHALVLLSVLTVLAELDLARALRRNGLTDSHLLDTMGTTVRNTFFHPVVAPVLTGLVWNAAGSPLPPVVDDILKILGEAAVPLCLILLGLSLAVYGVRESAKGAVAISLIKLLALPALVLLLGHWVMGLSGLPLSVVVMAAAMPVGSNALIFAQRYRTLEAEATAAMVFSTLAFALTAPIWLAALAALHRTPQ